MLHTRFKRAQGEKLDKNSIIKSFKLALDPLAEMVDTDADGRTLEDDNGLEEALAKHGDSFVCFRRDVPPALWHVAGGSITYL